MQNCHHDTNLIIFDDCLVNSIYEAGNQLTRTDPNKDGQK